MKAIVWTKYGSYDGLRLKDVQKPVPKDSEVLINIKAATVTAGDCEIRSLKLAFPLNIVLRLFFGLKQPKDIILGQEFAGEISDLGKDVTKFKVGDRVFGTTGFHFGTYAQFICLPETANDKALVKIPSDISYNQAAGLPVGGLEALHFFRKSQIKKGENVLINGAGGSIGTIAIQLFKNSGAIVTAVDTSQKFDTLHSAGADFVIDYTKDDFTESDKKYDVIFDVVGKSPFKQTLACLNKNGKYMLANPKLSDKIVSKLFTRHATVIYGSAAHKSDDLKYLSELADKNIITPIIDKTMPLSDVAKAHEYVELGLKKGNLIITID